MPTPYPVAEGVFPDAYPQPFVRPPGRTAGTALDEEIGAVANHALLGRILEAVQGLVAVLNENRQILALNHRLLESLGTAEVRQVLGLRLGEALHCPHAGSAADGCGTSEYCSGCGAAIAQVVALTKDRPCEQFCAIELPSAQGGKHLFFRVRAAPLDLAGTRYLLLFIQDMSQEQRAALIEQAFLHDLRNTATGLSVGAGLLAQTAPRADPTLASELLNLAERLTREIELQRCLAHSSLKNFQCRSSAVPADGLFNDLSGAVRHHPASAGRRLDCVAPPPGLVLRTDATILQRILSNMVINALEATPAGGTVRVMAEQDGACVRFSVWNPGYIPEPVARRIFQRNFSTKGKLGRGLGTYAMKLLGETLLGGTVSFQTSPEQGTRFTCELPL